MATTQEHRRARYMRKHAYKTARALARSVPSFAARQVDAATTERCARAIAEAAVDLTGAVFDALVRASPAPGPDAQESEAAEAQGRAPAKVSSLDIWRAPSLVNWCLLGGDSSEDPEEAARADAARDKAEADLDAAFAKTSAWLRAQLQAGRRGALDEAFDDHLGPVMLAHIRSGAMDTEPCANVRLALREVASQMQVNPVSLARGLAQPTEVLTTSGTGSEIAEMQELAAGPHLTAHGYVSVPEQSLRSPEQLDKLVAMLLELRGQMSWPASEDEGGALPPPGEA